MKEMKALGGWLNDSGSKMECAKNMKPSLIIEPLGFLRIV